VGKLPVASLPPENSEPKGSPLNKTHRLSSI
jgi:hypothetical protein